MALNGNLDNVLYNIIWKNVAPVIKLSNGLYTLVDKNTVVPDTTLGTNLIGRGVNDSVLADLKIIGNWSTNQYQYDSDTHKWYWIAIPQ